MSQDDASPVYGTPEPVTPASEPPASPPAVPAPVRRGSGVVEGLVESVQHRSEQYDRDSAASVLSLRVRPEGPEGEPLAPVAVQLRAVALDGAVHEGDRVRAAGTWRSGTLHSKQIQNLTTGAVVTGRTGSVAAMAVIGIVGVLLVGGLALFGWNSVADDGLPGQSGECVVMDENGREIAAPDEAPEGIPDEVYFADC